MKSIGSKRAGFSLMELLAVVTILGIIAAIIVPRVTVSSDTAKAKVNSHNKATINAAVSASTPNRIATTISKTTVQKPAMKVMSERSARSPTAATTRNTTMAVSQVLRSTSRMSTKIKKRASAKIVI